MYTHDDDYGQGRSCRKMAEDQEIFVLFLKWMLILCIPTGIGMYFFEKFVG